MRAPLHHMKKADILWLHSHKCKHHHTYVEHYGCYLKEHGPDQKVGYFDIETTNLKATYGIMLCWCIYDKANDVMHESVITKKDLANGKLDKRVVQDLLNTMTKFDRIYTFYGTRFDLPFARTRAVVHGLKFPIFQSIQHQDVYYLVRNKFCLHSNRLAVACETLLGRTRKTRIDPNTWTSALQGKKAALDYIQTHCQYDVHDLADLHYMIEDYAGKPGTSI